ncbi:MAG TPA: DUF1398 family protein [Parachlamydiaceae bacterium]|nr:DUF1398 family protein [Parachlamydiaceae bacterium]
MNKAIIQSTIDGSLAGTLTFPEVVGTLLKEGIESYHVDFLRNENTYYHMNGDSLVVDTKHMHGEIAREFSAEEVKSAIKKVQSGKVNYTEFCLEAIASGCACYTAYLNGKKVIYFGRNGDHHVEHFPNK